MIRGETYHLLFEIKQICSLIIICFSWFSDTEREYLLCSQIHCTGNHSTDCWSVWTPWRDSSLDPCCCGLHCQADRWTSLSSGDPDECPPTSSHPQLQSQMLPASMSDHESGESSVWILHQSRRSQLVCLRDSSNTESIIFNFEALAFKELNNQNLIKSYLLSSSPGQFSRWYHVTIWALCASINIPWRTLCWCKWEENHRKQYVNHHDKPGHTILVWYVLPLRVFEQDKEEQMT